jgi:hypothetical protein
LHNQIQKISKICLVVGPRPHLLRLSPCLTNMVSVRAWKREREMNVLNVFDFYVFVYCVAFDVDYAIVSQSSPDQLNAIRCYCCVFFCWSCLAAVCIGFQSLLCVVGVFSRCPWNPHSSVLFGSFFVLTLFRGR